MPDSPKIKVTSRSFSRHPALVADLRAISPNIHLNEAGRKFSKAELIDFIGDADGLVLALDEVDDAVLAACPNLKIISKFGVGLNNLDLEACRARGIAVGWSGGVNRRSVSEMVLGFMLSMMRNLYPTANRLSRGAWDKNGGEQLSGKTVGVIGLGFIGGDLIRLLQPFGCQILGNDILDKSALAAETGIRLAAKDEIFERAQVVTLHTPLDDSTRFMIDERALRAMRPDAFLINTARGPLVREAALKRALVEGWIAGAALDVYEAEPPTDLEFLGLDNLFCTPHIGGNSQEAVLAMGQSAIGHLKRFFEK